MRIMLAVIGLLFSASAAAQNPLVIRVDPNSIQSVDKPMKIIASGRPETPVWLFVLRDCDDDRRPDGDGKDTCSKPLARWDRKLDARGDLKEELDFRQHPELTKGVPLWLSICATDRPQKDCSDALFSIGDDACGFLKTVWHAFTSEECDPQLLKRALVNRGGATASRITPFEVRLVDPVEKPAPPTAVPSTGGATGVSWSSQSRLIVTLGMLAPPKQAPGMYLQDERGALKQVWKAEKGETSNAPLGLPDGRIAFVITRVAPREAPAVSLAIWDKKRVRKLPLDRPVRALHGYDAKGDRLIGSTVDDSSPGYILIDARSGRITDLGYSDLLLHWVQRSPKGELSAIDYEDVSTDRGWEIALVDKHGNGVAELSTGPGDSWLPAWRPDGKKVAFLTEQRSVQP